MSASPDDKLNPLLQITNILPEEFFKVETSVGEAMHLDGFIMNGNEMNRVSPLEESLMHEPLKFAINLRREALIDTNMR